MSTPIAKILSTAALLALTGHAAAQPAMPGTASSTLPGAPPPQDGMPSPSLSWPRLHEDGNTQTWVGVRHNKTDGTVVGFSLSPGAYPAFQLELEVVPPGYGPADTDTSSAPSSLPTDNPKLHTQHKLSLRYRF